MMPLNSAEQDLLGRVSVENLNLSLRQIRRAVDELWSDTPRIIQYYTDHGIRHCGRVAENAIKLLRVNEGDQLSQEEIYLLVAGIYLHDIGMQCDIAEHPEIRKRAEALGAKFALPFEPRSNSNYTPTEQKEIRKNHQYLSAAWIACAWDDQESTFHLAAQTIPKKLIKDLQDVCLHHTKLPITDCPLQFEHDIAFLPEL